MSLQRGREYSYLILPAKEIFFSFLFFFSFSFFTKRSPAKAVLLEHVFRCQSHGAVVAVKYLGL